MNFQLAQAFTTFEVTKKIKTQKLQFNAQGIMDL